jgi:hypothetical protein
MVDCAVPVDHISDGSDCDDADAAIHPGADEYCDTIDQDCDGETGDDHALDPSIWYADADEDGYGDPGVSESSCDAPEGYVDNAEDCDDEDPLTSDCDFPSFDGSFGTTWEELSDTLEHGYSAQTYHLRGEPYILQTYGGSAQLYDIDADTWEYVDSSTPYSSPWNTMAPAEGLMWMLRNGTIYSYDIATDTWDTVTTFSGGDDMNMTESDEYGVVYGHTTSGQFVIYNTITGDLEYFTTGYGGEYETRLGYDPESRSILFGAYDSSALRQWYIDTGVIVERDPIPEPQLNDIFCSDRSGHIYAAGGSSGRTMFQYIVATDTWTAMPDLPEDHGNNGSCTVSGDGYLYVSNGGSQQWFRLPIY